MAKSDYAENSTLTDLLTGATRYLAMSTAATTDAGGITEPAVGAYARAVVAFTVTGNSAKNNAIVDFAQATASWGTLTHFAVFDALTSGNMLYHGVLDASVIINNTDILRWAVDALELTED
jgi:hypothetical protein